MKRIALVAAVTVAAMAASSSAALAAPATSGGHGTAALSSIVRTVTPYTFSENVAEYYGEVTCTGRRIVSAKYPNGKDVETCAAVSGKLAHMVPGKGQTQFENTGGGFVGTWASDYDGKQTNNYTYSVNAKLTKFHIVAIY